MGFISPSFVPREKENLTYQIVVSFSEYVFMKGLVRLHETPSISENSLITLAIIRRRQKLSGFYGALHRALDISKPIK